MVKCVVRHLRGWGNRALIVVVEWISHESHIRDMGNRASAVVVEKG